MIGPFLAIRGKRIGPRIMGFALYWSRDWMRAIPWQHHGSDVPYVAIRSVESDTSNFVIYLGPMAILSAWRTT